MSSTTRPDIIELGRSRDGYPALASWIARDPDSETFIFRKFNNLAARILLHQQSRLIAHEHEIAQLDEVLRGSTDLEARQSLRRWETLMQNAEDASRTEKKLVERLEEAKTALREYRMGHSIPWFNMS